MHHTKSRLDKIERRYDPENDAASVSWVEYELMEVARNLIKRVEELEQRIAQLEQPDENPMMDEYKHLSGR
jgi:hypothetical protein